MLSPSHKECWARSSVFDGSWPACAPFQVFTCFANPELDCCSIIYVYIYADCRSQMHVST